MPTETFSIVTAPYAFTMETEGGNLVSLIATDDEDNVYDCLIQLMPRNPELGIECCRPGVGCTSGICSEI